MLLGHAFGNFVARTVATNRPEKSPLKMQVASVDGVDPNRYWAAGTAPILEIIGALDPFHQPDQWGDLRAQFGFRVTSSVIEDASHALFSEQPCAVASAVIDYLATLT